MKYVATDLETTSTDVDTTVVVQAAAVVATNLANLSASNAYVTLCHAAEIPAASTEVHGITAADVFDAPPFSSRVGRLAELLCSDGAIVVTYNGASFDLPIVERYLRRPLNATHVDVFRLWKRVQAGDPVAACYAGTLAGAHLFFTGETFDGAHDAAVDCLATLRTFAEMLARGLFTLAEAIELTKLPLPGCVDFAGKFKWIAGRACIAFGKHRGTPIEELPTSYLTWMSRQSFPPSTMVLIANYRNGGYPSQENET